MKKSLLLGAALVAGMAMQAQTTRYYLGFAPETLPANAEAFLPGTTDDPAAWQFYIWMGWDNRAIVASATDGYDSTVGNYTTLTEANDYGYFGCNIQATGMDATVPKVRLSNVDFDWTFKMLVKTDCPEGMYMIIGPWGLAEDPYKVDVTPANFPDADFTGTKWNTIEVSASKFIDHMGGADDDTNLLLFRAAVPYGTAAGPKSWLVSGSNGAAGGKSISYGPCWFEAPNADDAALDDVVADSETVAVEYIDIQGRVLFAEPDNGLFIKKEIKADGSVKTSKIVK
ncbi:MAG: hypothetical protein NC117_05355 [Pseudoflavonifractor sp.]|nr:hypothetical protein [Pseudoflavonifractor sp.]